MNRTWTIVLIGALSFMVFVALGGVGIDKPVRVMIVAGAVAGVAWLCWFDYGRKKNQARRIAADGENRFRELSALAAAPQFELVVTARSSMILAAGSIVMGVGLLWWVPSRLFSWDSFLERRFLVSASSGSCASYRNSAHRPW